MPVHFSNAFGAILAIGKSTKNTATAIITCNKSICCIDHVNIVCLLLVNMKNHQIIESVAFARKYVLTLFNAENERSVTVFVAGLTIRSLTKTNTSNKSSFSELSRDCGNFIKL